MKKLISNYTFDPVARTISFADYTAINLEGLLLVTNVTDNQIIYNFADPCFGGGVNGNTVTLTYDTTSMSSTDALQIYYDDNNEGPLTDELFHLFMRLSRIMQSNATVDSADRQIVRVGTIDGGTIGTVTNVGTVGTVSTITGGTINTVQNVNAAGTLNALNSVDTRYLLMDTSRNTYANLIRPKLIS